MSDPSLANIGRANLLLAVRFATQEDQWKAIDLVAAALDERDASLAASQVEVERLRVESARNESHAKRAENIAHDLQADLTRERSLRIRAEGEASEAVRRFTREHSCGNARGDGRCDGCDFLGRLASSTSTAPTGDKIRNEGAVEANQQPAQDGPLPGSSPPPPLSDSRCHSGREYLTTYGRMACLDCSRILTGPTGEPAKTEGE